MGFGIIIIILLIILIIALVILRIGKRVQPTKKTGEPISHDQSTKKSDDSDIQDQPTKLSRKLTDHAIPSHEQSPQIPAHQLRYRFVKEAKSEQNHDTEENHTELDIEDRCSISAVSIQLFGEHSFARSLTVIFPEQRL